MPSRRYFHLIQAVIKSKSSFSREREEDSKGCEELCKGFKHRNPLGDGLPVLYWQERLSLEQYSGMILSQAKGYGKSSSSIRAACDLVEGCVQQMLVASSTPQQVSSDSPGASLAQDQKFRQELRAWRGRASIVNTVTDSLWQQFGQDSCRIYEAVVGQYSFHNHLQRLTGQQPVAPI